MVDRDAFVRRRVPILNRVYRDCIQVWLVGAMRLSRPPLLSSLVFYFTLSFLFQLPELALLYRARELLFDPSVYGVIGGVSVIPWTLKPLWGYVVDRVHYPVCVWCILCFVIWVLGWHALTLDNISPNVFALGSLAVSFALCFSDVIVDSITVIHVRDHEKAHDSGSFQTRVWQVRAVGGLIASIVGGYGVDAWGTRPILFACMGLLMPSFAYMSMDTEFNRLYAAKQQHSRDRPSVACTHAIHTACRPGLRGIILFSFAISATPSIGAFLAWYIIEQGNVSTQSMMLIDVVDYVARILGATLWHRCLRSVRFRVLFGVGTLLIVALKACNFMLLESWIAEPWQYVLVVALDGAALCMASQVLVLPIMNYVAKSCDHGTEGSTYAFAISMR